MVTNIKRRWRIDLELDDTIHVYENGDDECLTHIDFTEEEGGSGSMTLDLHGLKALKTVLDEVIDARYDQYAKYVDAEDACDF